MKKFIFFIICVSFLTLSADPPDWEQIGGTQFSMLLRTQVTHQENLFEGIDAENILAAFGPGGTDDCRAIGFWIEANPPLYENGFWDLGIVSNQFEGEIITFKIYEASTDSIFDCYQEISFTDGITIGSSVEPYMLSTSIGELQGIIEIEGPGDIEKVTISAGTGSTHPTWNAAGFWEYSLSLSPGIYDVSASMLGYEEEIFTGVEVEPDEITSGINFYLEPVDYPMLFLPAELFGIQGEVFTAPLYISIPAEVGIEGINVTISFDEEILEATSATLSGSILENENYTFGVNTNNPGEIILGFSANGELYSGSGIIAFIQFSVNSAAEVGTTTEISFTNAVINEFVVTSAISVLTVMDQLYQISGNIEYFKNETTVPNVLLVLEGIHNLQTSSNDEGSYLLDYLVEGNYSLSASKSDDLGGLSGTDASRVFRHSIGLYNFSCHEMIAADVTLDATISTTDASRIARYAAGLIQDLNSGTDWVFFPEEIENCEEWPPIIYETDRYYSPLNENLTAENFIGVRLGDVTGNWSSETSRKKYRDDPEAFLPDIVAGANTSVSIPLTVNEITDLEAFDITILYDATILTAIDATLDDTVLESDNYSLEFNCNESGAVTLIIYATSNLFTGSGEIAYIEFDIIAEAGSFSDLIFSRFDVNETDYLENTTNGSVTIVEVNSEDFIIPAELSLEQNHPNPFHLSRSSRNNGTLINFQLPQRSSVDLSIYNLQGKLITSLKKKIYDAGYHKICWNGKDEMGNYVSSGIYYYRLKTEFGSTARKMMIIK
jgi:hypothetical protein